MTPEEKFIFEKKIQVKEMNINIENSRLLASTSVYLALIVGVAFPLASQYFTAFISAVFLFTAIYLIFNVKRYINLRNESTRAFAILTLLQRELKFKTREWNTKIDQVEKELKEKDILSKIKKEYNSK